MVEWSITTVLKTVVPRGTGGSNPSLSAKNNKNGNHSRVPFFSITCAMIYPQNYEQKIGFNEIRSILKGYCLSTLGKERVDELAFSADAATINEALSQVREMRRLMQATEKPEMNFFFDVRESVARIRLENTHLEEDELLLPLTSHLLPLIITLPCTVWLRMCRRSPP